MEQRKFAAILGIYGRPADRFMSIGYKAEEPSFAERLKMAAAGGMVRGLELIEGEGGDIEAGNAREAAALVRDHGLEVCAVNPNLWGERHWRNGTLASKDPALRQQAVDRIRRAMDVAAEVGCDYVGIWPGQDGYDYLFEADYLQQYEQWVKGIQTCAGHNPQIRIGLEYKPYEPRTHSVIDTAPKTLLMLRDINQANVGLTLDIGHAMYAHENLAEVVALSMRDKKLFHLHLNDNYADWDWDLNFASVHLLDFIEMVYWLKRTGYQGWYSIDIFAYRLEARTSIDESLAWLAEIMDFVEAVGMATFDELIKSGDPLATSQFFRSRMFAK